LEVEAPGEGLGTEGHGHHKNQERAADVDEAHEDYLLRFRRIERSRAIPTNHGSDRDARVDSPEIEHEYPPPVKTAFSPSAAAIPDPAAS
jgi:hypothetical protein